MKGRRIKFFRGLVPKSRLLSDEPMKLREPSPVEAASRTEAELVEVEFRRLEAYRILRELYQMEGVQ